MDSGQRAIGMNIMAAFQYLVSPVLEFNLARFRFAKFDAFYEIEVLQNFAKYEI